MNTGRNIARIVGALFLISNVTFLLGSFAFIEPTLNAPDYLTLFSEKRPEVVLGVLLELINCVAYISIALLMFPILKQRFAGLALGYVGLRLVEFVTQILTDLSPLSLVTLSEKFVAAGAPEASAFQVQGAMLIAERAWAFQMLSLVFGISALMFYTMLYQTKLIPSFLSIWGLIGAVAVLANTGLDMFGIPPTDLGIVMLLNEVFLGVWLIVRGFSTSIPVAASVKPVFSGA